MRLKKVLWIFIIAMLASQNLFSQEKVDTTAMKQSKGIHQTEWEQHEKMRTEENPQFKFSVLQTNPNPFSSERGIEYYLPTMSKVTLAVHDKWGNRIRTLVDGAILVGNHRAIWDCRGNDAQPVPSGIYIVVFNAIPKDSTKTYQKRIKIFLLR